MIRAYRLLTGKDDAAFCHRVTAALNNGWLLHEAPTIAFNAATGETVCAQAITKEVQNKSYAPDLKLSEL